MKNIILVIFLAIPFFCNAQIPSWADSLGNGIIQNAGNSGPEIDPTFTSSQAANIANSGSGLVITNQERANYNLAYGWGDHSVENYLKSFTEADPTIAAYIKSITAQNVSDWNGHLTDTNNPHSVTKAQIGLGNVDDTSDANKPISNATQIALNAKQSTLTFDATPINGSNNPVTSDGVFDAIASGTSTNIFNSTGAMFGNLDVNGKQFNNTGWVRFFPPSGIGFTLFEDSNGLNFTKGGTNYRLNPTGVPTNNLDLITKEYFDNSMFVNYSEASNASSSFNFDGAKPSINFSSPSTTDEINFVFFQGAGLSNAIEFDNDRMVFLNQNSNAPMNFAFGTNTHYVLNPTGVPTDVNDLVTKEYFDANSGGANWSTVLPTASFLNMNGIGIQESEYYAFSDPNSVGTNWNIDTDISGAGNLQNDLMFFNSANGINAAIPRDGNIDENKHLVTKEYFDANVPVINNTTILNSPIEVANAGTIDLGLGVTDATFWSMTGLTTNVTRTGGPPEDGRNIVIACENASGCNINWNAIAGSLYVGSSPESNVFIPDGGTFEANFDLPSIRWKARVY